MKWNAMMKQFKEYQSQTDSEKLDRKMNRSLHKLNRLCLRNRVRFKRQASLNKNNKIFMWKKGALAWRVVVTETGFTGLLTYEHSSFYMGSKTLLKNEVDYYNPKDLTTTSHYMMPQPLSQYLKSFFESGFDVDALAWKRKREEMVKRRVEGIQNTYRPTPAYVIQDKPITVTTNQSGSGVSTKLTITSTRQVVQKQEHPIELLDRDLRKREERLHGMLKGEMGILSYEQEHLMENLVRDRKALMMQFHSEHLLNREDILSLVEEGLLQLVEKMEALEQSVAVRQKQDVERLLLLIKER